MAKRLSVAAIERLKPHPSKRREIADAAKPGLYLVVQPSGRKSFAVRYRINGASRKLTLKGFPSIDMARKLAQDALDAVAEGRDPAREKIATRNLPSNKLEDVFAEFLAKYVRRRDGRPIRESSRRETARLLGMKLGMKPANDDLSAWEPRNPKSGVLLHWSGRDVQGITKRDVLNLLDVIVKRGAPVGANRTLAALKTAFGWFVKRDILVASPCDHVDGPSPEQGRERALEDSELVAIWRAAEEVGYPYGSMVQLLLLSGQRRDEARQGVRPQFDLSNALWKIPGLRTKNWREHHVPLSDAALRLLAALPKIKSKAGWLFTIEGIVPVSNLARRKRRLDAAVLRELRKSDPEAQLRPWRLHDLRHTLKTFMQRERIPKDVRNAVQNHFDRDMDELYGHYSFEKEKRDALDRWSRHVEAILSGKLAHNVVALRAGV